MRSVHTLPPKDPASMHARALEHLSFVRETLESSGTFTSVPGRGMVIIGVIAIVASWFTAVADDGQNWLLIWLATATVSYLLGGWFLLRKAQGDGVRLSAGVGRRFLMGLSPPLFAGAVLTLVLYRYDASPAIPGTWLLLYGIGVFAGGAFSVRIVPIMGISFIAFGLLGFVVPFSWTNIILGAGFGGLHVFFGLLIGRYYGG